MIETVQKEDVQGQEDFKDFDLRQLAKVVAEDLSKFAEALRHRSETINVAEMEYRNSRSDLGSVLHNLAMWPLEWTRAPHVKAEQLEGIVYQIRRHRSRKD